MIELLIVIAIIAIIAGVVFVALDPLQRFQDARNARRTADITNLLSAIKINQVDNGGSYQGAIGNTTDGSVYMIGTDTVNCNSFGAQCPFAQVTESTCVDLTSLASSGYLGSIPVSPNGGGAPSGGWTAGHSGYTLSRAATGIITITACESENLAQAISLSR